MSKKKTLNELLTDIENRMGAYNQDPMKHAENVIEANVQRAKEVRQFFDDLVAELRTLEQNPNIHCNNCKDISAQNLLSWILRLFGEKHD